MTVPWWRKLLRDYLSTLSGPGLVLNILLFKFFWGFFQDTPTTAKQALFALHKVYIERSGGSFALEQRIAANNKPKLQYTNGTVNGNATNSDCDSSTDSDKEEVGKHYEPCICEISPLVSYAGENLKRFIEQKKVFTSPTLLCEYDS